ncbi:lamin Dm0-like [Haliotis cracherodii]|uniref:lamin Dm0-like n=1 Tax=Haliotis cracherodii TaxID=6455 RepID=UPI0039E9F5CD
MASRTKKTTTTTYSSRSDSGIESPGSIATSPRRQRPPSPARRVRLQEKEELMNLNDRLAAYIDKVRHLETENTRLYTQVRSTEEVVKREVTNVKSLYESELADARKLLDDTAKEKARLQIELNRYKESSDDWQSKYYKRDREAQNLEKKIAGFEATIIDLQQRLSDAESKKKPLEKENANLRAENAALQKQLDKLKAQLEEETLLRVDLENRVQSLKEDIAFKSQVYEKELDESRTRTTVELEEVDGRLQAEYEDRLAEALREMRAQHEHDLHQVKVELEVLYENKLADLQNQVDRSGSSAGNAWDELRTTRKKYDDLSSEVARLRSENASYGGRISELEERMRRERDEFLIRLEQKDAEIAELRQNLDDQAMEYADLLEIKIRLDREIDAYRKLLEGEEARLNLSQSATEGTPRKTPKFSQVSRGAKRKRVTLSEAVEEYSQQASSSGFSTQTSAKGAIEIKEVNQDGNYIRLTNKSAKPVNIGGWQLKHTAGDDETVYKFHRNVSAKPGQDVTVWSSDTETTHDPPSDLVMKGQRWFISDTMKTVIVSKQEEVASCDMTKSTMSSSSSYRSSSSRPSGELLQFEGEAEDGQKEKCAIM